MRSCRCPVSPVRTRRCCRRAPARPPDRSPAARPWRCGRRSRRRLHGCSAVGAPALTMPPTPSRPQPFPRPTPGGDRSKAEGEHREGTGDEPPPAAMAHICTACRGPHGMSPLTGPIAKGPCRMSGDAARLRPPILPVCQGLDARQRAARARNGGLWYPSGSRFQAGRRSLRSAGLRRGRGRSRQPSEQRAYGRTLAIARRKHQHFEMINPLFCWRFHLAIPRGLRYMPVRPAGIGSVAVACARP